MLDERTEQLINRKLDHELSEGESLELNKRLIRSPEARAALEASERIDAAAAEGLRAVLRPGDAPAADWTGLRRASTRAARWERLAVRVAAVAVIALVITTISIQHWNGAAPRTGASWPPAGRTVDHSGGLGDLTLVDGPRRENERLQRNVLGVMDPKTGSVYLLESDQQQTSVEPLSMNF